MRHFVVHQTHIRTFEMHLTCFVVLLFLFLLVLHLLVLFFSLSSSLVTPLLPNSLLFSSLLFSSLLYLIPPTLPTLRSYSPLFLLDSSCNASTHFTTWISAGHYIAPSNGPSL